MRKLYLMMVACLLCAIAPLSSHAAVYITGEGFSVAWSPSSPEEFSLVGNGLYLYEFQQDFGGKNVKLSTVKGDWPAFNAAAIYVSGPELNTQASYITGNDGNVEVPAGTYKVYVNTTKGTITFGDANYTEVPDAVDYPTLYVRGESWGTDWPVNPENMMDCDENGIYTKTLTYAQLSQPWKIDDGNWTDNNFGTGNKLMNLDQNYDVFLAGDNMCLKSGLANDDALVLVTFDYNAKKVVCTLVEDVETVETPVIAVNGNTFTLSCATEGADIYYTVDGTTPSAANIKYEGPVTLGASCTIKAIAIKGDSKSDIASTDFTYTRPIEPGQGTTIYFNMKSNWVQLCRMDQNNYPKVTVNGVDYYTMEVADRGSQIYSYTFTDEQMAGASWDKLAFSYYNIAGDYNCVYNFSKAPENGRDTDKWTDFIFTMVGFGNTEDSYAQQATIGFDEWKALAEAEKEKLYFVGNFAATAGEYVISQPVVLDCATNNHNESFPGIFYGDLNEELAMYGESKQFKVSWMDPTYVGNATNIDDQRRWNTFDLGILGVDRFREECIADANDLVDGVYPKLVDEISGCITIGSGTNGTSEVKVRNSMPLNNFNQYDWKIVSSDDARYVVVDLTEGYKTLTLITFEPYPNISDIKLGDVKTINLNDNAILPADLAGSTHNGAVYINRVNTVDGEVTVKSAAGEAILNVYDGEYQIYQDKAGLGIRPITTGERTLRIPYLVPDADESTEVGLRTRYINKTTHVGFHSVYNWNDVRTNFTFAEPEGGETEGRYILYDENKVAVTAQVPVNFGNIDSEMFCFGDYEFLPSTEAGTSHTFDNSFLVHKDHWLYNYSNGVENGTGLTVYDDWTYLNEGDEYDDNIHNWSRLITGKESLPICIYGIADRNLDLTTDEEAKELATTEREYHGYVYAAYPFLVNPNAQLEVVDGSGDGDGDGEVTDPKYTITGPLYFRGQKTNWNDQNGYQFTGSNGVYTLKVSADAVTQEFKFCDNGTVWFSADNKGMTMGTYDVGTGGDNMKMTDVSGDVYITFNANTGKVTFSATAFASAPKRVNARDGYEGYAIQVTKTKAPIKVVMKAGDDTITAVGDIAVDTDNNAPAEYFTLQGVRVQGELTPGLYICRKGNTTSKIIVR